MSIWDRTTPYTYGEIILIPDVRRWEAIKCLFRGHDSREVPFVVAWRFCQRCNMELWRPLTIVPKDEL